MTLVIDAGSRHLRPSLQVVLIAAVSYLLTVGM